MKRLLLIILAAILVLLSACGGNQDTTPDLGSIPTQPPEKEPSAPTQSIVSTEPSDPTDPTEVTEPTDAKDPTEATVSTEPWQNYAIVSYVPEIANGGVTYTALPALPALEYRVYDPQNLLQLATERFDHSFGVAADGKPHHITVSNQQRLDGWGTSALTWDNISEEKVLYLTFDCGYEYQNLTSQLLDVLKEKQIPAAFFCTMSYIRNAPEVVARMIEEGHCVGNHSFSHPSDCAALSREELALEALAVENFLRVNFGYSSQYFRFPAGVYSENAVELLRSVGYRSVFWSIAYADWDPENQVGEEKAFQTVISRLHPGAVVLLHSTSPDNAAILADFTDYAIAQGYEFRSLDDYPGWK